MDVNLDKILKKIERSAELMPYGFYEIDGEMSVVDYATDISFEYKDFPKDHRIMIYSKDDSFTDYFIIKKFATVYDYIRIPSEDFPKYEDLSEQQSIFLSNKLMELLHTYMFDFKFPKKYPKKKYYPILLKAMFNKFYFYNSEYSYHLFLCDFDYKHCVFGKRRYCKCRKDARLERRDIRKGIVEAMTPMPDDAGEQIALLAKQFHYDEDGNFVRRDEESPF